MHPVHNCHHIKSCDPPVKQYITTHHNTEFIIYTCSLFFICNTKVSRARAALWDGLWIYCILASSLIRIPPLPSLPIPSPPISFPSPLISFPPLHSRPLPSPPLHSRPLPSSPLHSPPAPSLPPLPPSPLPACCCAAQCTPCGRLASWSE